MGIDILVAFIVAAISLLVIGIDDLRDNDRSVELPEAPSHIKNPFLEN